MAYTAGEAIDRRRLRAPCQDRAGYILPLLSTCYVISASGFVQLGRHVDGVVRGIWKLDGVTDQVEGGCGFGEHEGHEGDEVQAGEGRWQALVVAGETAEAGVPGEGALNDRLYNLASLGRFRQRGRAAGERCRLAVGRGTPLRCRRHQSRSAAPAFV
jgi:hypothetical protein